MLKEKEDVLRKAMLIFDVFLISVTFVVAFFLRQHVHEIYTWDLFPQTEVIIPVAYFSPADYLAVFFLVVPLWILTLYAGGMYASFRVKNVFQILWTVIKAAFLATLLFGAAAFLLKLKFVSRAFFLIFTFITTAVMLIEKLTIFTIAHYARRQGYNYRSLMIVGTGRRAAYFANKVKGHPEWGLRIAGMLDYEEGNVGKEIEGVPVIGTLDRLQDILHDEPIDEVIFIVPRSALDKIEKLIYICETEGVKATISVDLFDLKIARARLSQLEDIPLITLETTVAMEWQLFIKRIIDVIASFLGIMALSPLLLLVAALIKITSDGPVLYMQKRVGLNGRRFILYKFRSMYKGAHEKMKELLEKNEMSGPVFKMKDDPRITPFGKLMRKFSIDELPQLFNVLFGQMSLVGPRPALPVEVAQYEPWQRRRLSMRPGITCIWQISGRNRISFEEWMKLDLQYIDSWSLKLDFIILAKTIPAVLSTRGAS